MNKPFRFVRLMAATMALAFLFAAAAGPWLWAGEGDGRAKCLEILKAAVACLEFFYPDLPQLRAALLPLVVNDYFFCLKYLGDFQV